MKPTLLATLLTLLAMWVYPGSTVFGQAVPYCTPAQHDASRWHFVYSVEQYCLYGHEHGDAPPAWIGEAGLTVGFDADGGFHGNTSHAENTDKHAAMKGFADYFIDYAGGIQQVYVRVHIAANAMDRTARFHSYQVFMQDAAGGVSYWTLWLDSGDPNEKRFEYNGRNDPGGEKRPLVLVQSRETFPIAKNEHWYTRSSVGWGWDINWTVDPPMYWEPGEVYSTFMDPAKATGQLGTVRRMEPAWYGPDSKSSPNRGNPPRGVEFWSNMLGEIVSGLDDLRCQGVGAVPCAAQFIATTAKSVEARIPGGTPREREFPGRGLGVRLPN